jgi:hypothetical protein
MLDYCDIYIESGASRILDEEGIEGHVQIRRQSLPHCCTSGGIVSPPTQSLHDRMSNADMENGNRWSDGGEPPPYEELPELRPRALRMIGHVHSCGYITTGQGDCAEGCVFLGTTLLSRPWHMMVKKKGGPAAYVQLQLVRE